MSDVVQPENLEDVPSKAFGEPESLEDRALNLRKAGVSYDTIAKKLGFTSYATARKAVLKALERSQSETAAEARELEARRLDDMTVVLTPSVLKGNLKAMELNLKVMERRAKLLGLDSPVKFDGDIRNHGGVLMVPGAMTPEDWEQVAQAQQVSIAAPKEDDAAR